MLFFIWCLLNPLISKNASHCSHVWLFVAPWTIAHQAPLSMEFSRQEYWSSCHFLLQGILLTQGSNPKVSNCNRGFINLLAVLFLVFWCFVVKCIYTEDCYVFLKYTLWHDAMPSLFLVTFLVLKLALSEVNMVITLIFFWLLFACISFYISFLLIYMYLYT